MRTRVAMATVWVLAAGGFAVVSPAICLAQTAPVQDGRDAVRVDTTISALTRGAPCAHDEALAHLRNRIDAARPQQTVLYDALLSISLSDANCEPLREAAGNLAWDMVEGSSSRWGGSAADQASVAAAAAVATIVTEAFAEADVRAAQLSFEVGPPPRNITRNRPPGS